MDGMNTNNKLILISCIAVLLLMQHASAVAASADSSLDPCTSGVRLTDILSDLSEQGHRIIYSSELIKDWMRVGELDLSRHKADAEVSAYLQQLLASFRLTTTPGAGNSLLIVEKEQSQGTHRHYIRGRVIDKRTREPLEGAIVLSDELRVATETSADGCYFLEHVAFGQYTVQITQKEYKPEEVAVLVSRLEPIWVQHEMVKSEHIDDEGLIGSRSAKPINRANPPYPLAAMRDKVSGYATVEFTVTSEGFVKNPKIIKAEPAGYFEENALASVKKLIYQRYYISGRPPEDLPNVRYTLKYLRN